MALLSKLKKFLVTAVLTAALFSTNNIASFAASNHQEAAIANSTDMRVPYASEIPQGAIILSETEQVLYFDGRTGEQVSGKDALLRNNTVFSVTAKHTLFQIPGGRIDLGIDVRASNHRARLKGINGWMNMDDLNSAAASGQSFKKSTIVPSSHFGAYIDGIKSFSKGHEVHVTWSYRVSVVDGSIPNAISGDETVTVHR